MLFNSLLAFTAVASVLQASASPMRAGLEERAEVQSMTTYTGKIRQRTEWRKMTPAARTDYIKAVKCLQTKPAVRSIHGAKTLFDSFTAAHVNKATDPKLGDTIHVVGQFLPWHRYFVLVHEGQLRYQCNYQGTIPYWDWTLDAGKLLSSPVFDNSTGFGGNGVIPKKIPFPYTETIGFLPPASGVVRPVGACVPGGPFKDYTLHVGPGNWTVDHCLARQIKDSQTDSISQSFLNQCLAKTNFVEFWLCMEIAVGIPGNDDFHLNSAHAGGHIAVGEDMGNMISSPNDPLFMLHHAQMDRIWDMWQKKDAKNRVFQIAGNVTQAPPFKDVTLSYVLDVVGLGPNVTIKDVMNTTALGYQYV